MKLRLIHVSNESRTSEAIYLLTIPDKIPAKNYCKLGEKVCCDKMIEIDADIIGIPLNYRLQRE